MASVNSIHLAILALTLFQKLHISRAIIGDLPEQHHLLRLHEVTGDEAIEVDTVGN